TRHVQHDHAQDHPHHLLHDGNEQDQPRPLHAREPPQREHHRPLVFPQNLDRGGQNEQRQQNDETVGNKIEHRSNPLVPSLCPGFRFPAPRSAPAPRAPSPAPSAPEPAARRALPPRAPASSRHAHAPRRAPLPNAAPRPASPAGPCLPSSPGVCAPATPPSRSAAGTPRSSASPPA